MTALTDHEARIHALNPNESFIVQAPAGSGKTELLTQRFLKLLATVNEPEEIIAITFTRKAAGEMRHRILAALISATTTTSPEEPHKKVTHALACDALARNKKNKWQLLENPNRLRVWTIDAFTGFLSARTPILAGFGSKPTIDDNTTTLYEEAARELLLSLTKDTDWRIHLTTVLIHLDNKIDRTIELLSMILSKREQWLPYIFYYHNNTETLHQKLSDSLNNIITENIANVIESFDESTLEALITLARLQKENDLNDLDTWHTLINLLLTKENEWRKTVDARLGFAQKTPEKIAMIELLNSLTDNDALRDALLHLRLTPQHNYLESQKPMIDALVQLLPILSAELRLIFQRHNVIDFIELNLAALRSLGDDDEPTDLALYLDYQIKHLLIDEFQDTSITQFTLLQRLLRGWEPHDGRSLFLVGDPMQSIYRFRNAEVGLFLRAESQGINSLPLTKLTLTHNYRSDQSIIDWTNKTFSHLFPKRADVGQGAVPYAPSHATKNTASAGVHVYGLLNQTTDQEALHVITVIKNIQQESPSDTIALLVRSRNHLKKITALFEQHQLIYTAVDLQNLSDCPAIKELTTLTRALVHRDDHIAWYALLRSPICGLTLHDLHVLASSHSDNTVWTNIANDTLFKKLSTDGQQRVARILPIFQAYFNEEGRKPFELAVKGVWKMLGYSELLSQQEQRNADRYFQLLAELMSTQQFISISELLNRLDKTFIEPEKKQSHLSVMTIHKSKGLEFDHVILPGLNNKPAHDDSALMLWLEKPNWEGSIDFIIAPIKHAHNDKDAMYHYLKHIEQKKLSQELKRLLYVAITRAKKTVHLTAVIMEKNDEPHIYTHSFADMLAHEFKNNLITSPITAPNKTTTEIPVLKRIAATWQAPYQLPTSPQTPLKNPLPENNSAFKRIVGTALHERLVFENLNASNRLKALGITKADLPKALDMIQIALINMQHDLRAQWILNPQHEDSQFEFPVTTVIDGAIKNFIIDRTFIDNGIRWIIDYKTSTPQPNELLADFLRREQQQYHQQLTAYAHALSGMDDHPIKLGLYFPLCLGWIEYSPLTNYHS